MVSSGGRGQKINLSLTYDVTGGSAEATDCHGAQVANGELPLRPSMNGTRATAIPPMEPSKCRFPVWYVMNGVLEIAFDRES